MMMNNGTAAVSMQQFSFKPKDTLPAAKKYLKVALLLLMKFSLLILYYFLKLTFLLVGLREVSVTLKVHMKSRS